MIGLIVVFYVIMIILTSILFGKINLDGIVYQDYIGNVLLGLIWIFTLPFIILCKLVEVIDKSLGGK